ncbi:MAG TPA: helix-turn-helix domain-containing protein [Candidatus Nanoarchaeia archaeon]|nr:helix-turn-helix domain-containing protein [Candidatus Nanoarchaeia archaeon]
MKEALNKIGLSDYEALCYLALIEYGPKKGKEVADLAQIPRTSVYSNLENLEKKGFLTLLQREPRIYQAKDPEIAIPSYVDKKRQALKTQSVQTLHVLKKIHLKQSLTEKQVEVYLGKIQSYQAAKALCETTRKELLIITSGEKTALLGSSKAWISLAKEGILIRILVEETSTYNQEIIRHLQKNHIPVRLCTLKDLSLIVSDRKIAHIAIKSEQIEEKRIVIRIVHETFAKMQASFFDQIWKKAERL